MHDNSSLTRKVQDTMNTFDTTNKSVRYQLRMVGNDSLFVRRY